MITPNLLRIDASGRYHQSMSRQLTDYLIDHLQRLYPDARVITRDLAQGLPYLDEEMIIAYNTPEEKRTSNQKELLQISDELVEELKVTDILVIGVPMYNFTIPATLKAYLDLVVRSRLTFRYTENGPKGLLSDKKTYILATTAGTKLFGPLDYMSDYLRHILGFMGIHDVEIIAADGLIKGGEGKIAAIYRQIDTLITEFQAL
ncbi:MAG: FMN-dependent NADH-azoreductase [Symploca sp. SIO2E9]|nr:FMN-dependent NADH-azoreductase [Symploca sp. SIO2E9]